MDWNGMKHFDNSEVPQDPQTLTFCIPWASRLRTASERRCTAESSQLPSGPIHSSSPQSSNRSIWFWIRRLAQNNCAKIIYLVYLSAQRGEKMWQHQCGSAWYVMAGKTCKKTQSARNCKRVCIQVVRCFEWQKKTKDLRWASTESEIVESKNVILWAVKETRQMFICLPTLLPISKPIWPVYS